MIRKRIAALGIALGLMLGGAVAVAPVTNQAQAHQELVMIYCYKSIGKGLHFSWRDGWHTSHIYKRVYCSGPDKGKTYTG